MGKEILRVKDLDVSAADKEILHGANLSVGEGEVHVLMGPNGAGKSTLGSAIMGDPRYTVTGGSICFKGEDIRGLSADKIAKKGVFMTFQAPVEVPGVSLRNFIRSALEAQNGGHIDFWDFLEELRQSMELLDMNPDYADRALNVGFSGGEKKKSEILQLLMLKPALAILDETDSGLDVDAVRIVSEGIRTYRDKVGGALLIITHSTRITESLKVDRTHVLVDGHVAEEGGPELIDEINAHGFERFIEEEQSE